MSTFDQSDALASVPLPVESASRHFVFLPGVDAASEEEEMLTAWVKWGGQTEFVFAHERAAECGILIFRRGSLGANNELAALVKPFFVRHGSEANIFEFDPFSKNFWRVNLHWLETYYAPTAFQ